MNQGSGEVATVAPRAGRSGQRGAPSTTPPASLDPTSGTRPERPSPGRSWSVCCESTWQAMKRLPAIPLMEAPRAIEGAQW